MHAQAVSLLKPDDVNAIGNLPPIAICGFIQDEGGERRFVPNRPFIDFMHRAIAAFAEHDPGIAAAARQQGDGYLYIIDQRTPDGPSGSVPPEDIVGAHRVAQGRIVPGGYEANPHHLLVSANGLVRLPPAMEAFLVAEIRKAAGNGP
ncbi:MAG: hypothetical protein DI527_04325 [Chelatococcus sp.]|nr:MAG: hypothetical protein DI527_04325 [Chelatococcus sp.]